jgi:hypothetical protein
MAGPYCSQNAEKSASSGKAKVEAKMKKVRSSLNLSLDLNLNLDLSLPRLLRLPQPPKTTTRQVRSQSGLCVVGFMQVAEERK